MDSLEQSFWAQTVPVPESGCILWLGSINNGGYGYFNAGNGSVGAHRYAYETKHGPIPPGDDCCHKCDVRCCVNPEHLFSGSRSENLQDAIRKGRFGHDLKETCINGHANWRWAGNGAKGQRRLCVTCARESDKRRRHTPEYRAKHAAEQRDLRAKQRAA